MTGTLRWGPARPAGFVADLTYAVLVSLVTFAFSYGLVVWVGRSYVAVLVLGVAFCCWRKNWHAGVLCLLLGIVSVISLLPPELTFTVDEVQDVVRIVIFIALAGLVCTFSFLLDRQSQQLAIADRNYRRAEQLLKRAQETARFWTWELDMDRRYTKWVNPYGVLSSNEYAPLEQTVANLHPDDRSRFLRTIEEAQVTGEMALEFRILSSQGPRWIMARATMEEHPQGHRRLVGVSVDIGPETRTDSYSEVLAALTGLDDLLQTIEKLPRLNTETRISLALSRDLLARLQESRPQSAHPRIA